jgi:hypothetical protein
MTRDEFVEFCEMRRRDGRMFSVEFVKRSTGEVRVMLCRLGVTKHLRGGEPAYDFAEKGLLSVWSVKDKGYRAVSVEGVKRVKVKGVWVSVDE